MSGPPTRQAAREPVRLACPSRACLPRRRAPPDLRVPVPPAARPSPARRNRWSRPGRGRGSATPVAPGAPLGVFGCRYPIWYHGQVDAAVLLQEARRRSGLSRRELARRGHTSASTLSAYESGASVPSVATLVRILRAAGFEAEATLRPAPVSDEQRLTEKIESLFAFVDVLPRRRRGPLRYPVFPAPKANGR